MEQVGKIIGCVLLGMIVGFAVYGMGCAFTDMRNFKDIAKECEERGYIQDATDRFACVKEKR
jgi:hypothetical protein